MKTMSDIPVTPAQRRRSRRPATQRTTLADVAQKAGVSLMTASRALSDPRQVSEKLRLKVEQAVAELGYVPNRAARALASARSHAIAVLVPSFSNAVFTDVLAGIQDALGPDGYQLLIGNTRYSSAEEETLLRLHLQSHPAGILLTGLTQNDAVNRLLDAAGIPVVSMMDLSQDPGRPSVGLSQYDAGYAMIKYLLSRGYRRIGYLAAQLDERTVKRTEGYRAALREAGVYDPRREVLVPDPSTIALGGELVGRLLANAPDCDAVFCCNDDLAYGAIYQCQRRGIDIPRELAICGFNDLPASAWMKPSLTSIATPRYRVGYEAAQLLKRLMAGEEPEARNIDLGFSLIVREST
jgi:LacI family gluconate utilization system Gnt-I transcriptional repressor